MPKLTRERLLAVLDYVPSTGALNWKVRSSNRIQIGDRAGVVATNGYRYLTVDGEKVQASRLAWLYVNGVWPSGDIKFKDDDTDNCSIDNLRDVSRIEGARLRQAPTTNTTGHKGVSPYRKGGFKASVTCNYKQINLGVFPTMEEAIEMQVAATGLMSGAITPAECDAASDRIIQFRRKKVAWNRLQRSGRQFDWESFEQFCVDVGAVSEEDSTVAAANEALPIGKHNFRWLSRPKGKFDRKTKEGRAAYAKAYRAVNPGQHRHEHLRRNYKIDEIEFNRLSAEQGGHCAICQKPETKTRGHEGRRLSVDHNHVTGDVRGLLCGNCNEGIGYFGDDIEILRKAIAYLQRHEPSNVVPFGPAVVGGILGAGA